MPKPTVTQSCSNCHYFLQTSTKGTQQIGYCRANPPIPYFEVDETTGIFTPKIGRFPVVLNNMWCGSWDLTDADLAVNNSVQDNKVLRNAVPKGVA